jgi:hypothetical protein
MTKTAQKLFGVACISFGGGGIFTFVMDRIRRFGNHRVKFLNPKKLD